MFSDRLWILKAAAALGLLSAVFTIGHLKLEEQYPPIERVALFSGHLRGRVLHRSSDRVLDSDPQGFRVDTRVGPMRFLTSTPPAPGEFVSMNVRVIGPRTLEVIDLTPLPGYSWKRPLNYGVSILTLLVYLWLVRGRFRWKPQNGVFRGRY
jgi:hypothetical protein